ncbi:MAG: DNA-binding response regulator [Ardenticatenia bacterium]|nr:MAG: DNA-binding response regulator [Ardenticatenia bacterium]
MSTILVVDDEQHIFELVRLYLEQEGFHVAYAADGVEALRKVTEIEPDLVVLDVMLPELDGLSVCRQLRQDGNRVPIILLTARGDDIDKILGLELGADDYVTKPFNPRELVARVKAVLRRVGGTENSSDQTREVPLALGRVRLFPKRREVFIGKEQVYLRPKEFDLLETFLRHPGQVLSREQILNRVWGYDYVGETRTVDVHVASLRDKLEESGVKVETVWGIGYKLVEEV